MSASDTGDEEIPGREIAYRLFAAEYDDASLSYAESDEERAPNYVVSPTGARINRLFVVGTLTEVTAVNDEMVRARVVDPTGAFVVYAGQYQPDELAALEQLEPPAFVAVTGKARTFQPDDSDQVYTSIRPESIATVDADTRDRWVVNAAEQTIDRIGTYARAGEFETTGDALTDTLRTAGVESGLAAGIPLAQDHYGTTPAYLAALRDCALEAVEVVAGDRDQVSGLSLAPDESNPEYESATFESLANLTDIDLERPEPAVTTEADTADDVESEPVSTAAAAGTATSMDSSVSSESSPDSGTESGDTEVPESEPEDSVTTGDDTLDEPTTAFDESTDPDETVSTGTNEDETASTGGEESEDEALGDFDADDGGMYEMDEEEREELEAEFGTEFTTGSEVDEPGTADIDVPESDDAADQPAAASESVTDTASTEGVDDDLGSPPESGLEAEPDEDEPADLEAEPVAVETDDAADESADSDADDTDDAPADDIDLQSSVIETMQELDDGDGADRTTLVETVADDTDVSEAEIEDAIQDALMGGECYEPGDERLKAI
ncbi:RPA family protein [Natronorubrum thiooxidans]|uniref:Rpa-associated protein n=1 Tax=Natronorubrum thiooxidans TaxID=308853 RepID=A0A1N7FMT1_9EURY|nr:hypothetical protein [Natronorubrum thiooxidans]SIS01669.1 hypothetical protein SAMN05421752_107168 [Natronorubrum thiooxidans]